MKTFSMKDIESHVLKQSAAHRLMIAAINHGPSALKQAYAKHENAFHIGLFLVVLASDIFKK